MTPSSGQRPRSWSAAALLLVVALLLGSVLIPARFTSRILRFLGESRDVVEPARRAESELELTLGAEETAVEEYALTGDPVVLARYHESTVATDRWLSELDIFGRRMDGRAVREVTRVRAVIDSWRQQNRPSFNPQLSRGELSALLRAQQVSSDAMDASVAQLES